MLIKRSAIPTSLSFPAAHKNAGKVLSGIIDSLDTAAQ